MVQSKFRDKNKWESDWKIDDKRNSWFCTLGHIFGFSFLPNVHAPRRVASAAWNPNTTRRIQGGWILCARRHVQLQQGQAETLSGPASLCLSAVVQTRSIKRRGVGAQKKKPFSGHKSGSSASATSSIILHSGSHAGCTRLNVTTSLYGLCMFGCAKQSHWTLLMLQML